MSGTPPATEPTQRNAVYSGTLYGVVAYALGLLATTALRSPTVTERAAPFRLTTVSGSELDFVTYVGRDGFSVPSGLQMASWLYHRAHFVPLESRVTMGGSTTAAGEQLVFEFTAYPEAVVFGVAAVAVVAAGVRTASAVGAVHEATAAKVGAYVAIGYAVAGVASAALLSWQSSVATGFYGEAVMSVRPDIVLAGVASGGVGAVGGAVGGRLAFERGGSTGSRVR